MLDEKGEKILAKSLFKELRSQGYAANQILALTNELLDLVTQELHEAITAAHARDVGPAQEHDEESARAAPPTVLH